jgi:hypothetical protein
MEEASTMDEIGRGVAQGSVTVHMECSMEEASTMDEKGENNTGEYGCA